MEGRLNFYARESQHAAGAGAGWGTFWGFLFGLIFFVPSLALRSAQGWVRSPVPSAHVGIDDDYIRQVRGKTVGSGHFCQLEVSEQVYAMIDRFLAITLPA